MYELRKTIQVFNNIINKFHKNDSKIQDKVYNMGELCSKEI